MLRLGFRAVVRLVRNLQKHSNMKTCHIAAAVVASVLVLRWFEAVTWWAQGHDPQLLLVAADEASGSPAKFVDRDGLFAATGARFRVAELTKESRPNFWRRTKYGWEWIEPRETPQPFLLHPLTLAAFQALVSLAALLALSNRSNRSANLSSVCKLTVHPSQSHDHDLRG